MILEIFKIVGLLKPSELNTDWVSCKLVYKGLLALLMYFTAHCTYLAYHDHQLRCFHHGSDEMDKESLNMFCWNHGVYVYAPPTSDERLTCRLEPDTKYDTIFLDPSADIWEEFLPLVRRKLYCHDREFPRQYHIKSKNIGIFFAISCFTCYIGKYMWDVLHAKLTRDLISNIVKKVLRGEDLENEIESISNRFIESMGAHDDLCNHFGLYLVINFLVVYGQLWFLAAAYGDGELYFAYRILYNALYFRYEEWPTDLLLRFPISGMCDWSRASMTGRKMTLVHLCDLPNSYTYQMMLAVHSVALQIVMLFCLTSICTHLLFIYYSKYRHWEMQSCLGDSGNFDTTAFHRMSYGSAFVYELLTRNIATDQVIQILKNVDRHMRQNIRGTFCCI